MIARGDARVEAYDAEHGAVVKRGADLALGLIARAIIADRKSLRRPHDACRGTGAPRAHLFADLVVEDDRLTVLVMPRHHASYFQIHLPLPFSPAGCATPSSIWPSASPSREWRLGQKKRRSLGLRRASSARNRDYQTGLPLASLIFCRQLSSICATTLAGIGT